MTRSRSSGRRWRAFRFGEGFAHLVDLGEPFETVEEERKPISRELHDVIAQTLVGINVHLSVLDKESTVSPAAFRRQLSKTQRLVRKAVGTVHEYARELRPRVAPVYARVGMKERAEMIGGSFQVESAPGEPTTVMVEVPAG